MLTFVRENHNEIIVTMVISYSSNQNEQDRVPILINDALEHEVLSWDNTQIEGKKSYTKSSQLFFHFLKSYVYFEIFNQKIIFVLLHFQIQRD